MPAILVKKTVTGFSNAPVTENSMLDGLTLVQAHYDKDCLRCRQGKGCDKFCWTSCQLKPCECAPFS